MKIFFCILFAGWFSVSSFAQGTVVGQHDSGDSSMIILGKLSVAATDADYGFTPEFPVKVGKTGGSGPANQRAYLEMLRDAQGKKITYERTGSCCAYPSDNGLFGSALVDRYKITYRNEKNKKKSVIVYISFYDYEEPKILFGFTALQ